MARFLRRAFVGRYAPHLKLGAPVRFTGRTRLCLHGWGSKFHGGVRKRCASELTSWCRTPGVPPSQCMFQVLTWTIRSDLQCDTQKIMLHKTIQGLFYGASINTWGLLATPRLNWGGQKVTKKGSILRSLKTSLFELIFYILLINFIKKNHKKHVCAKLKNFFYGF